jgi:sterol desaturase/sphingolipid hydroxylase (fatty acid hydroxylase superfamily)
MKLDFIAFAIPFFVSFMLLEYYLSKRQNKKIHHFNESIANVNVGIVERISDVLISGSFFFVFSWLNQNFSLFEIKSNWVTWILLFLATDLLWYWYHRLGHEVNLFWAAHIVHHQSEDFNYTTAARITVFQAIARGIFWSILPIIGFKAEMITIFLLIHGTYPFFTHTQLIGKLGWLEYILVTPSHHRVHHSSNNEYLDKNYGDMLIIWDKMFGTFAAEKEAPKYGLTTPLDSHSFLWQHFHYVLELLLAYRLSKGFKQKMRIIFGSPNTIDPRIRKLLERKLSQKVTHLRYSKNLILAIKIKTVTVVLVLFFSILFSNYITPLKMGFITLYIILSVIITGAMLEQKKWIFHLEFLRFTTVCFIVNFSFSTLYFPTFVLIAICPFVVFYQNMQSKYNEYLFTN